VRKRALIIIDVQRGLFEKKNEVYKYTELISNINSIIDVFRKEQEKIIFVQHCNNGSLKKDSISWQIHPEIKVKEKDMKIWKNKSNVFKENKLINYLEKERIKDLVIVGLVTQGCVQAACISGKDSGLNITLIGDAHSNFNKNPKELINHWNKRLHEHGVRILNTAELINS